MDYYEINGCGLNPCKSDHVSSLTESDKCAASPTFHVGSLLALLLQPCVEIATVVS